MARTHGSHSDVTGPRVADAALRLFARHGYAAVSMRTIAAEVGVQVGTLYHYTPDKQTLLFDLMRAHMHALLAAHDALGDDGAAPARLERFVRFHIGYHLDRPDAVFISYMELRNLTPANFTRVEALRRAYEDRLEAILTDGAATGAFRVPDSRIATMAVIAMLTGVTTWYRPGGRLSGADVATLYWDMVRRAVAT
jgi:AcrR family transcriptional regulator